MERSDPYCVKMRASRDGAHVSGAERIVSAADAPAVAAQLTRRALPVATNATSTPAEGRALAAELLRGAGVVRIDEIMELFRETYAMRGAMLLDADTLERLEPDRARGVRA